MLSRTVTFSTLFAIKTNKTKEDAERKNSEGSVMNGEDRDADGTANKSYQQEELLLQQAASFLDFEKLFTALDAIEQWRDIADQSYE